MPPSSLPRHPREEAKLGTNKYKIEFLVVGSGFSIKRPVTVDTSIDRINLPCRGALIITSARSDLQGGVHLVTEHPTEAIQHAEAHPTAHQRGPRRSTVLSARGSWVIAPRTPGRCAPSGSSAAARSDPTTMMNWTSFRAFERDHTAESPHRNLTWR